MRGIRGATAAYAALHHAITICRDPTEKDKEKLILETGLTKGPFQRGDAV